MRRNLSQKKDPMQKPRGVASMLVSALRGKRRVDGFKPPARAGR